MTQVRTVPLDIYLNVAVSGLLTGLVYGLMALGLSGHLRRGAVVNFAHGEMMTDRDVSRDRRLPAFKLDPLVMMVPIAGVLFALGYLDAGGLINPVRRPARAFAVHAAGRHRDHHGQRAAAYLRARRAQRADSLRVRQLRVRRIIVDATKVYRGRRGHRGRGRAVSLLRFSDTGKAIRACADNYTGALVVGLDVKRLYALTFGLGAACVGAPARCWC
jgi:branched-chain amino acid transport system permease protein